MGGLCPWVRAATEAGYEPTYSILLGEAVAGECILPQGHRFDLLQTCKGGLTKQVRKAQFDFDFDLIIFGGVPAMRDRRYAEELTREWHDFATTYSKEEAHGHFEVIACLCQDGTGSLPQINYVAECQGTLNDPEGEASTLMTGTFHVRMTKGAPPCRVSYHVSAPEKCTLEGWSLRSGMGHLDFLRFVPGEHVWDAWGNTRSLLACERECYFGIEGGTIPCVDEGKEKHRDIHVTEAIRHELLDSF